MAAPRGWLHDGCGCCARAPAKGEAMSQDTEVKGLQASERARSAAAAAAPAPPPAKHPSAAAPAQAATSASAATSPASTDAGDGAISGSGFAIAKEIGGLTAADMEGRWNVLYDSLVTLLTGCPLAVRLS